jgi:hypothetical protein
VSQTTHPGEAIGPFVLGALEAEEEAEVRRHVAGCPACRREYDQLAGLPALLATMPEEGWTCPPKPSELGLQRLLARVRSERVIARRRVARRGVAAGVAAAAVAAIAVLAGVLGLADRDSPQAGPGPSPTAATWGLQGRNAALGISGRVTVVPVEWGSRLDVSLAGVKPGQRCRLVVLDVHGRRWDGGSWTVAYGSDGYDSGQFSWSGSVAIADDHIEQVEVVTTGGRRLLTLT